MPARSLIIGHHSKHRRSALNFVGGTLWHLPRSFEVAGVLGREYSLRCVLFHNISDTDSAFTRGLGGTMSPANFETALRFLTRNYTPVSLQDVLDSFTGRALPSRPVLVTFDDAYVSVCQFAAPLCKEFGVSAVFFVNAACLDNRRLALDNLVCYVANTLGLNAINHAIQAVRPGDCQVRSLTEVFSLFLPGISLLQRKAFHKILIECARLDESDLAAQAGLYLTSPQLSGLADFNFEIGNHTYTHVNCRTLSVDEFTEEIDENHAVLQATSGKKVRSFSVPYGSSADLTDDLVSHLRQSGYVAIFLAQGRLNSSRTDQFRLNRISIRTGGDSALFSEIEVLARLRSITSRVLASDSRLDSRVLVHSGSTSLSKEHVGS